MTPARLMRTLLPSRLLPRSANNASAAAVKAVTATSSARCDPTACLQNCRCFAQVNDIEKLNRDVWFTRSAPRFHGDHKPIDERTLQLGKTVRTLHERLPTLLQSPLPSDILSPQISLHLFPSTHPHLPTVSGRIAYVAALWTAPVAWGRVPLVGNVGLTIMSERMESSNGLLRKSGNEKLIVKWKTCGKTKHRDGTGGVYRGIGIGARDPVDRIRSFISSPVSPQTPSEGEEEFTGLFIFEFDDGGRIVKHVIEHSEDANQNDRNMTRVVSVTDWLLGQFNGRKGKEQMPELAWCEERPSAGRIHMVDRRVRRMP